MLRSRRMVRLCVGAFASMLAMGCSPQHFVGAFPDVVNFNANRTLRRDILAFATSNVCSELEKQSVPLRLHPDDPALGRFFPRRCQAQKLENGSLNVQFEGSGYAWSNVTKRVGFNAFATVQFDPDFRMSGSTAYVYFRIANVSAHRFEPVMVEAQTFPNTSLSAILPGGSPQAFVGQVGQGLFDYQLREGFTVIRDANGDASFAIGTVDPGRRPIEPFRRRHHEHTLYTHERVEIHSGQREYFGPITVDGQGKAIFVTLMLEGAQQIDVQVYPRSVCEPWLAQYVATKDASGPPSAPVFDSVLAHRVPRGEPLRRSIPLPPGSYYLVLDHTTTAGQTSLSSLATEDRVALVSVAIEVGSVR